MKFILASVVGLLLLQAAPQPPSADPVLTNEQKLQLQTVAQRLEIAQLKAQMAQKDFDAARTELQVLMKMLEKEGYTLDFEKLAYVKNPPKTDKK